MLTTADKSSTVGAPSPDALTGSLVRLWPYVPGLYGRDALYRVWKMMEDDGATRQAFWDDAYLDTGGDMASFVGAFEGTYNKGLLMVERLDTHELCGAFWATNIVRGHQAFASMWMHTAARGQMTVEAAHLALANMFEVLKIRQIWSMTPWVGASALCLRMRFEHVAVMPDYCQWDGQLKSVHLYRLTKERFDARPHH